MELELIPTDCNSSATRHCLKIPPVPANLILSAGLASIPLRLTENH
jgi:hypothetical protein